MEEFKNRMYCHDGFMMKSGLPEEGIEPGTKWEDVPEDWVCPDCGDK